MNLRIGSKRIRRIYPNRFPPNAEVNSGIGRVRSEYDVIDTAVTDASAV